MDTHKMTLTQGIVGAVASAGAGIWSWLELAERGLRVFSLIVGISVGILTFISIYRRMKREDKERK